MTRMRSIKGQPGIRGWIYAGNYKLERYLYILHRVTGLGLLLSWVAYLVRMTTVRINGQDVWVATLALVHSRWFGFFAAAFVFHSLNGVRLGLQELGFTLGRPTRPIYPYRDSLRRKRPFTFAMTAVSAVLALTLLYIFLVVGVRAG